MSRECKEYGSIRMIHSSKINFVNSITKEGMSRSKRGLMKSGFTGQKDAQLRTQESKKQATETTMKSYSSERVDVCEHANKSYPKVSGILKGWRQGTEDTQPGAHWIS